MVYYINTHGNRVIYEDLSALLDDVMDDKEIIELINNMYGAFNVKGQGQTAGGYTYSTEKELFEEIKAKYIKQLCIVYNELIKNCEPTEDDDDLSLYVEAIKRRVYVL